MKRHNTIFIFKGEEILIKEDLSGFPEERDLGTLSALNCGSFENYSWGEVSSSTEAPRKTKFISRRSIWNIFGDELFSKANSAYAHLDWMKNSLHCGRCGSEMENAEDGGRICPSCGFITYPVISPAIIVAVERGDSLLLAHNSSFPEGRYSVIAGFVDLGENLEDAVRREVMEEVGIEVEDISYLGSQSWPFPRSLMVGFQAKWRAGDINEDGNEIVHADWFKVRDIPNIPPGASISRRLIDDFIDRHS